MPDTSFTLTLTEAWQFLNATDRPTADAKQAARHSVIAAVAGDYGERFRRHLRQQQALLAAEAG
jgi:hypothetical protein